MYTSQHKLYILGTIWLNPPTQRPNEILEQIFGVCFAENIKTKQDPLNSQNCSFIY
jgi:hypothetical protein